MKRDSIDLHHVPEHQLTIHLRLVNWALWCNGPNGDSVCPMFRLAIATARAREVIPTSNHVDPADAAKLAKHVAQLPPKHRAAINWWYVKPVNPRRAAASIGVPMWELASLVVDARQMLMNRGVDKPLSIVYNPRND